jgi:hypothetical protein
VRRLAPTTLLALLLALACAALPASASAACPGADVALGSTSDGSGSTDVAAAERSMLCLVNEYRAGNGLAPLVLDERLGRAARAHAEDMVARNYFSHVTPEGLDPTERAVRFGFPAGVGENIAYSSRTTPRSMFEQWRTSPGHDANMRGAQYTVIGLGFALGIPPGGAGSRGATGAQSFGRVAAPDGGDTGLDGGDGSTGDDQGEAAPAAAPACRPTLGGRPLSEVVRSQRRRVAVAARRVRDRRAAVRRAGTNRQRAAERRRLATSARQLARAHKRLRATRAALARASRDCR